MARDTEEAESTDDGAGLGLRIVAVTIWYSSEIVGRPDGRGTESASICSGARVGMTVVTVPFRIKSCPSCDESVDGLRESSETEKDAEDDILKTSWYQPNTADNLGIRE